MTILLTGCREEIVFEDPVMLQTTYRKTEAQTAQPQGKTLNLQLQPGDRFPFYKRIEQQLVQEIPGSPQTSRTLLELWTTFEVEEIRGDRTRLELRFERIRFQREMDGQNVAFDSDLPQKTRSLEESLYRGLQNNPVSFWISAGNQNLEWVGYEDFLRRCVRHVPDIYRPSALTRLEDSFRGFGGLLDIEGDGITLLENGTLLRAGDRRQIERRYPKPVAVSVRNEYKIDGLNENAVEVAVAGRIVPAATHLPESRRPSEVTLKVLGGKTIGSYTIDRNTGMPIRAGLKQILDMTVKLPNGSSFRQSKSTNTTIKALPQDQSRIGIPSSLAKRSLQDGSG